MRKIKTIDDITKDGKVEFGEGYEFVGTAEEADAILMRSTDLHGYELPEGIRAIARCGAGVNNIPVEEYAKKGVVVFNSPGANSNAVKELVLGMLVLSSRGVVQSMNWVRNNADDPEIQVDAEKAKKAFVGRELKGKRIGVIGFGVSNQPLVRVLLRNGCDVTVCDRRDRAQLGATGDEAAAQGAKFILGADYLEHLDFDVIFRTPGVLPIVPQLRAAAQSGAILTSEMEAFCNLCPCRIIAITGSDGKTTTSTITAELLRAQGYTVHLGGNIGTPLFDRIPEIRPEDFAVLELSSFQLHSMHCAPDVAIITNISPNHLDVHPDFEDYVSAKCSIYRGQRPDGCLVLNAKDAHTPRFAAEAPGRVRYFSSIGPVENGVYCTDGVIYRAHDGKAEKILDAAEIRIPGAHNVENYMAAFAATDGLVGNAACVQVAHTFSGVPHRMERIRELNGITFINDSIASSPTRTIAGLHALPKPPVIILGGHDKHIPFDTLGDEVCLHAKAAVVVGETAQRIAAAIRASKCYDPGKLPLVEAPDFRAAVETAYGLAQPGDIVTLSPSCSSFDFFKNFEERGNTFRAIVESLQ